MYRYGKHSQYKKIVLPKVIDFFIIGHVFILFCFRRAAAELPTVTNVSAGGILRRLSSGF